jgi:hypothetical protein
MALSPDQFREIITFEDLLLGEAFEFSPRIGFSEFRRKQTARKISENTYEMGNAARRIGNLKAHVRRLRY